MGLSHAGQDRGSVAAAQPFPCGKQGDGESSPECDAGTGPEQALLDRVAHEKEPAKRQGEAPNPNGPTRAEPFVPTGRSRARLLPVGTNGSALVGPFGLGASPWRLAGSFSCATRSSRACSGPVPASHSGLLSPSPCLPQGNGCAAATLPRSCPAWLRPMCRAC